MTREPREALSAWITSTGYTHREIGALFGVTKDAVRQWVCGNVRVPAQVQRRLVAEGWLKVSVPGKPPLNHTPLCPVGQPCRSCTRRRQLADPDYTRIARRDAWLPEHEARLCVLAGTLPTALIAATLTAEFGIPRSTRSIYKQASLLQVCLIQKHHNARRVAWLLGVSTPTIGTWIRRGWLASFQPQPGGHHGITAEALEQFIRTHPGLLDWRQMPGVHGSDRRWRDLVQQLTQRDPCYAPLEAARLLGVHEMTVGRWCRAGRLHAWYVLWRGGRVWRIPRSAVLAFERQREAS